MVSGQLPRELGTPCFWDILPSDVPTYMSALGRIGYQTTCVGKMHFHGADQMHGWHYRPFGDMERLNRHLEPDYDDSADRFINWKETRVRYEDYGGYTPFMLKTARPGTDKFMIFDESVTRESSIHLRDYFSTLISEPYQGERPLLFEASFKTPHCPFVCPPDLFDHYHQVLPLPTKPPAQDAPAQIQKRQLQDQPSDITETMIRNARAGYWGLVQWMDQQIGFVLDALEQTGHADEFIILYTSDHGEMAGERGLWQKTCFYEESARVPMLMAGPGIPQGGHVYANTSHLDLMPTIQDLAGIQNADTRYGRSMLPLLENDHDDGRIIFSEYFVGAQTTSTDPGAAQENGLMAKKGHIKFIDYCDGDYELFNLEKDPGEQNNVADDDSYAEIRDELRTALDQLPAPWRVNRPEWRMQRGS